MLRGYRGIILALAGLALLGANPVSYDARGNPATAQSDKRPDKKEDVASGISRIGEALEAQNAKTDPYEEDRNKREIRDLQAQENSAYWAQAMFWATVGALVLSFIGIGLVWITFRETKSSNKIAKAQTRAQLRIASATVDIRQVSLAFLPEIINDGPTGASNVSVEFAATIWFATPSKDMVDPKKTHDRFRANFSKKKQGVGVCPSRATITPDDIFWINPIQGDIDFAELFARAGQKGVSIWVHLFGFIQWIDIFGDSHEIRIDANCKKLKPIGFKMNAILRGACDVHHLSFNFREEMRLAAEGINQ